MSFLLPRVLIKVNFPRHKSTIKIQEAFKIKEVKTYYLQTFNVVLLDSGGGGVGLDGGEDGLEVGEGDSLLAQLGGATGGFDGSVGHVAAQSAEDVA